MSVENKKYMGWIKYDLSSPDGFANLPNVPGCYVIYLDNELVYIGQSFNVRGRLLVHIDFGMTNSWPYTKWGSAKVITVKVKFSKKFGDWLMVEARLLAKLKPRGNVKFYQALVNYKPWIQKAVRVER